MTSAMPVGVDKAARTAAPILLVLPFVITFLDSAFAYFGRPRGFNITPNALVPFILAYFAIFDPSVLKLPLRTLVWLGLVSLSFCLAILTAVDISVHRLFETGSCVASFYAGFLLWRRSNDENQLACWMIVMSLIYVAICLIALKGIAPAYFPVDNHYWSQEGVAQARPAVTADSNMQIYYVFPAALALALPFQLFRTSIAVAVSLGALYVLAQLQTRSGTLVFAGILLLALAAPLFNPSLGRKKMLIYPVIGFVGVIAFWPTIHGAVELLLYRFNESDMASGNGRVESTMFAFQHLLDPYWWIPRGANEFLTRFGGLPHSNITAVYLDGGLLGLIAWGAIVIVPICQMTAMMFRRQTDAAAIMALIAAIAVLLVQLSLHNPFRDQVWLWAGAVTGALVRLRTDQPATAQATAPMAVPAVATTLRVDANGIINAPIHR